MKFLTNDVSQCSGFKATTTVLLGMLIISSFIIVIFTPTYGLAQYTKQSTQNQTEYQTSRTNTLAHKPLVTYNQSRYFLPYENPNLGITVEYDPKWDISQYGRYIKISAPLENASDTFRENVLITVSPSLNQTMLDIINNDTNFYQQNYRDFKLVSNGTETTSLGGNPAYKILYEYNDGNVKFREMRLYALEGDNYYAFIYTAQPDSYNHYLPSIQRMINSFQRNFLPYEDINLGITVEYPPQWSVSQENITGVTFSAPLENASDTFRENVRITVSPSLNQTMLDIINNDTNFYQQNYNYTLEGKEAVAKIPIIKTNLGENLNQSRDMIYKYKDQNDNEYTIQKIYALKSNKIYMITYTAESSRYNNYLPTIPKLISSFRLLDFAAFNNTVFTQYKDNTTGITIDQPNDWKNMTDNGLVQFQSPSKSNNTAMSLNISSFSANGIDLKERINSDIAQEKEDLNGYGIIELHSITIAKNPAYKLLYGYTDGRRHYQKTDIYVDTKNTDKKLQISYAEELGSYSSSYMPIIQQMIKSLKIHSLAYTQLFKPGIRVGVDPVGIAVDSATDKAYVANQKSDSVSVIDIRTNKVMKNITLDSAPYGVAADAESNRIYVTGGLDKIFIIDGVTDTIIQKISETPEGEKTVRYNPVSIAFDPDSADNNIFVANKGNDSISVFQSETNTKTLDIPIDAFSGNDDVQYIAVNPITNKLYVALDGPSGLIGVIDYYTDSNQQFQYSLKYIPAGQYPGDIAINQKTNIVYVSSNSLTAIDGATDRPIKTVTTPEGSMAVNPITNKLYMTNGNSGTVTVVNGTTLNKTDEIITGGNPYFLDINPKINMLYVTNPYLNSVNVINGSSHNIVVSVDYRMNSYEGGHIICNGKRIQGNNSISYEFNTKNIECDAVPHDGFDFASWSGAPIAYATQGSQKVIFNPQGYGTIAASFHKKNIVELPPHFWEVITGLISISIGHSLVQFIIDHRSKKRQTKYLREYLTSIDNAYHTYSQNKEKCLEVLERLRRDITHLIEEGSIDGSSYAILDGRVSEYINKVKEIHNGSI